MAKENEAKKNILGYDKDNPKEYAKEQAAIAVLDRVNQTGFRKSSKKAIAKAKEDLQSYRQRKAETFLEEHKARIKYYGMEIKAYFDELPNGLLKPSLTLADFDPFKELAKTKPWSEALEENLATRINCEHKLNEDGTVCEKCGLNPENWGSDGTGVTNEYQDAQRERIEKQKAIELKCEAGEHELNEEAKKDPNAPMRFCVHCRKPESEWEKPEAGESGEDK